jgi:hypothetical protein
MAGILSDKRRRRSGILDRVRLFTNVIWIGLMATLIVLNSMGYVVGASFGCTQGCLVTPLQTDTTNTARRLDAKDHDALGWLQLAAKGLEVWFIGVMAALVYDMVMLCATKHEDGLPFRYLMLPEEFTNMFQFFDLSDTSLWTSFRQVKSTGYPVPSRKAKPYIFLTLLFCICGVSNLMGPASAVLLLPTSGWRELKTWPTEYLVKLSSSEAPGNELVAALDFPCESLIQTPGAYACMWRYDSRLDMFMRNVY